MPQVSIRPQACGHRTDMFASLGTLKPQTLTMVSCTLMPETTNPDKSWLNVSSAQRIESAWGKSKEPYRGVIQPIGVLPHENRRYKPKTPNR